MKELQEFGINKNFKKKTETHLVVFLLLPNSCSYKKETHHENFKNISQFHCVRNGYLFFSLSDSECCQNLCESSFLRYR